MMSREPCDGRRRGSVALAAGLAALLAGPVATGEPGPIRIDLYDAKSNRTGYAVVDPTSGRVDTYDARSNRTGWGTVSPSGAVDLYDLKGRRTGSGRMDPAPGRDRKRTR